MMVEKINVDEKIDDKLTICPDKFLGGGMSANVYGGFYTDEFG
jgi:hypothetical protein